MTEWISCKDRMPERGTKVLVQTKKEEMFVAKMDFSHSYSKKLSWFSYGTGGRKMKVMSLVIAWMPLPEPYVEEKI